MSDSELFEIETLLKKTIGLEIGLLGDTAIENALKRRLGTAGMKDLAAYRAKLAQSPLELQALIDSVVVPETWFFRDKDIFHALAGLLPRFGNRALRLLSIPCATGEEPYGIAITLLDAGWPAERFRVDAVDVSIGALARAQRGHYGRNSFREKDFDHLDRYFDTHEDGRSPIGAVRQQVHFAQGNLLDPALLTQQSPYDVIFCRNVLIYFDRPTQEQVLRRLRAGLNPDGLLFVGASEQNLAAACDFTSLKLPRSFAFELGSTQTLRLPAVKPVPPKITAKAPAPPTTTRPFARQIVEAKPAPPADPLAEAQLLADQGRFDDAIALCNGQLQQGEPGIALLHLLGLIHDAAGHIGDAEQFYRKVLYLDPNHRDTLAHLSLLLHRNRDARARTLDARLARLNRQEEAR